MRLTWQSSDSASTASIGFAIAAAIVGGGLVFAETVVHQPAAVDPRTSLYDAESATALELLVRDPGRTTSGAEWTSNADQMTRFGLALKGQPNFMDYVKVKALRNGTLSADASNKAPDYPEVKAALGVNDKDIHMRTYPILPALGDPRWTKDPHGRVAYFAHYSGASSPATLAISTVRTSLALNVSLTITNAGTKDAIFTADVGVGNKTSGSTVIFDQRTTRLLRPGDTQTVWVNFDQLPGWAATNDGVHVVLTDSYGNVAVDTSGTTIGDVWTSASPPVGSWNSVGLLVSAEAPYYVTGSSVRFDTDAYDGSGGHPGGVAQRFVLVGPDGNEWRNDTFTLNTSKKGTSWVHVCPNCTMVGNYTAIAYDANMSRRAMDTVHVSAAQMFTDKTTLDPKASGEAAIISRLMSGFNPTRYDAASNPGGDIFADDSNGPSDLVDVLSRYNWLIVGSEVSQNALTPSKTKNGIADWVQAGGNLIVLGTKDSQSHWLEPIYHAAQENANGAIAAPDPTNPILVAPEHLAYKSYLDRGRAWSIDDDQPFTHVLTRGQSGDSIDDTLAYANPGALGNGTVVLTSYMPGALTEPQDPDEAARLMHNLMSQGYTMLFLDYGPPIPPGVPVGSAQRLVAVPHPNVPGAVVEVKIVLYVFG